MILHCMVCSIGGDYIGEHTKIASVDEESLKLPLDSSMFGSFWPERGLPAPWQPGLNWLEMKCPRCGRVPWTFMPDDTARLVEQGGPDQILTDRGLVDLDKAGFTCRGAEADEPETAPDSLKCPHCDFTGKSAKSLKTHITMKHGKQE